MHTISFLNQLFACRRVWARLCSLFQYVGLSLLSVSFLGCATEKANRSKALPAVHFQALTQQEKTQVDEWMLLAQNATQAGQTRQALGYYQHVWQGFPSSLEAPEALYRSALLRMQAHQYADAFKLFDQVLSNYPSYERFNDVVRDEFELATCLMNGNRPYYFGLVPGFRDYDEAIEFFEGVVKKAPFTDYAPLALMNIAWIAEAHGKKVDAVEALDRLINTYPQSILMPDAYLKLADLYASMVQGPAYDQGATKDAIRYYEYFLVLFPTDPQVARAEKGLERMRSMLAESQLYAGNLYRNRLQDNTAALVFYNEAINAAAQSQAAQKARAEITRIQNGQCCVGTPIDFLFSKPEHDLSGKEYAQQSYVDARQTEMFEVWTDEGLLDTPGEILDDAIPLDEALQNPDPMGRQIDVRDPLKESLQDAVNAQ